MLLSSDLINSYQNSVQEVESELQNENQEVIYCSGLSYDQFINHNFRSLTNLEIQISKNKEWNENLFRAYISLEQNNNVISSQYKKKFDSKIVAYYQNNTFCEFEAKVRIHGDYEDHIDQDSGVVYSSLDVELLNGNIDGMTKFKLFLPKTRNSENEIFISSLLNRLDILSPRTRFIDTKINNVFTRYLIQEKISKEFLEGNNLREGPIIEYYEENLWESIINNSLDIDFFSKVNNVNFLMRDINNFTIGLNGIALLNNITKYTSFINEDIETESIQIDYKLLNENTELNRFDAALLALGATHGLIVHNRKFYYDPLIETLLPIYYDGLSNFIESKDSLWLTPFLASNINLIYIQNGAEDLLTSVNNLKENYLNFKEELIAFGYDVSDIEINNLLIKFEKNLKEIKSFDNTKQLSVRNSSIEYKFDKAYFEIKDFNIYYCYIEECSEILIEDTKNILNNEYKIDENNVYLLQSHSISNQPAKEFFIQNFKIIVFGNPVLVIDEKNKVVDVIIKDINERIVFLEGRISNWKINVKHEANIGIPQFRNDSRLLTGCITFKDIEIINLDIIIENSFCEDSLNIVNSDGYINSIEIKDASFDGVDFDFSKLNIKNLNIKNSKNDCLDLSYGEYFVETLNVEQCGDKGISVGEKSELNILNASIETSQIGVAVKDSSYVDIAELNSVNNLSCISIYQKKQEFGPSKVKIGFSNCDQKTILVEKGSILIEY